jgi:hypothetical protein
MDDRLSVRNARLAYPERGTVDLYILLFAGHAPNLLANSITMSF